MSNQSKLFTVMVVGDKPEELMAKYKIGTTTTKRLVYKYLDAKKMQNNSIKILKEILQDPHKFQFNNFQIDCLKERLSDLTSMSTLDYYAELTKGLEIDDEGNAWSNENPNGKWKTFRIGRNLSVPFILNDSDEESHCACKGDINWLKMHMANTYVYEKVWDLVINHQEPQNEEEKVLLENMSDKDNYFARFKTLDDYVTHNCAYWNYAYLDENGWQDMETNHKSDMEWIKNFYDNFVVPLQDNSQITIYECSR